MMFPSLTIHPDKLLEHQMAKAKERREMDKINEINDFRGQYRWLSNFEYCTVVYKGTTFPSSEHAYQAMKSDDPEFWKRMAAVPTCKGAKALGYKAKMVPDWDQIKSDVMYEIVKAKFAQNPHLAIKLISTGDANLVEGNTWGDTYWGVCNGVGENNLGKILMAVRSELQQIADQLGPPKRRWTTNKVDLTDLFAELENNPRE